MKNLELLKRMIDAHNLEAQPYEVFLGKLQTYLNTQLDNKEKLVEMFEKSNQLSVMCDCPDCGIKTLLGFQHCNFCGCELLEMQEEEPNATETVEQPVAKTTRSSRGTKTTTAKKTVVETKTVGKKAEPVKVETEPVETDTVDETEDEIMKMRRPSLGNIIVKYGLEIDIEDDIYAGRKIKELREHVCDDLFGEPIEEPTKETEKAPAKETKKAPAKETKKAPAKAEPVKAEPVKAEPTTEGEEEPLPDRDAIFAMSKDELVALIKKENLGINVRRYRKEEALAEAVDAKIEELFGDSAENKTTEATTETPSDEFGLDDLDNVSLDEELELS